jgi:hypothetical protein
VRVGVVQFAERGDGRVAWVDVLCEALGRVGKEVFEMGGTLTVLYHSPTVGSPDASKDGGRSPGPIRARATDVLGLADIVMACSVAPGSRDIEAIVSNSDLVITGLKELEDGQVAMLIAEKPILLIPEAGSPPSTFADRSVVYSGEENLVPLIRKILQR